MMTRVHKRNPVWGLLALLLMFWLSASQAMTLRELRALEKSDKKQGDLYARYYLVGVMEGAVEVSAQAERDGRPPTICLRGRRLEPRMARDLFDGELRRNKDLYEADFPVQFVMTQALVSAYSCE